MLADEKFMDIDSHCIAGEKQLTFIFFGRGREDNEYFQLRLNTNKKWS